LALVAFAFVTLRGAARRAFFFAAIESVSLAVVCVGDGQRRA
jgi:hypothetical protein